jgi:aspartate carbamoyltransferase
MEQQNVFASRSLCVIEDFSIEERLYLFEQVKILKTAMENHDAQTLDRYRIDDKDFGIYEVFLEDSTRTKESFRNAANFHHAKVSELNSDSSSFNKGESYADTFYTLSGYANTIFIVRSKLEGVCRWLEDTCSAYAKRNKLYRNPPSSMQGTESMSILRRSCWMSSPSLRTTTGAAILCTLPWSETSSMAGPCTPRPTA